MSPKKPAPDGLMTVRTTVVLLCALLAGACVGGLTYLNGAALPAAFLAFVTTGGAAALGFHKVISN